MVNVSVVTTVFNETENQLERAINSVRNQQFENGIIEHVIVIDNPAYKHLTFLQKLSHSYCSDTFRIKLLVNSKNLGPALSANNGVLNSSFNLVARLDADDWMMKDRIQVQSDQLLNSDACVSYSSTSEYSEEGRHIQDVPAINSRALKALLPLRNIIVHSSVMYCKKDVEEVGLYRDFSNAEDYDLLLRLLNSDKKFVCCSDVLTNREIRKNSVTRTDLDFQIRSANFVRKINKRKSQKQYSIENKPQPLVSVRKRNKKNKKIAKFHDAKGLKKALIGFSSFLLLRNIIISSVFFIKKFFYKRYLLMGDNR